MRANAEGNPREAQIALTAALEALAGRDDPEADALRVRADITMALARLGDIGIDAASAALTDAITRARALGEEGLVMLARIQQAGLVARVGRWGEAVTLLEGIEADGRFVGARELSAASVNRGLARQYLGQVGPSEADLLEALEIARAGGAEDLATIAIHNLGCLALLTGDVPRALTLLQEAGADGSGVSAATSRLDIARAHIEAGLVDEAVEGLWAALRSAVRGGLPHVRGEILLELARCALLHRDPTRAARYAGAAGQVFEEHRAVAWRERADILAGRSALDATPPGSDEEREAATHVLAITGALDRDGESPANRHDAACLAAEAAVRLGDLDAAEAHLARARSVAQPQLTARLHRDLLDASLADATGDADRRRRALHRASRRVVTASGRYSGLDARTATALHGYRLATVDLRVALATGRPRDVLEATERWRALSLLAPPVRPSHDDRLRELTGELRVLTARLDDAPDRAGLTRRLAALEQAINDRERTLAAGPDGSPDRVAAGAEEIVTALRVRDARCVSFCVAEDDLYAVSLGAAGERVVRIGAAREVLELTRRLRADLNARALAPAEPLRSAIRRSCASSVDALDRLVARAVDGTEGRLVVVPSWATPSVPWRLLPSIAGRPLTVAPSATFWLDRSAVTDVATMVAVAGPGIRRSDREVTELARLWPAARVLRGADATADRFTGSLRDADVVHVAAHGRHDEAAPHFSSIRLADGPAFAHEFQRVGVGAAHVVLASCDSALARVRPGDEALGLTASLLTSGVRSVLAAVAPVDDDQTHDLMTTYHHEVTSGRDAAAALEAAADGIPDGAVFAAYGADWSATLR